MTESFDKTKENIEKVGQKCLMIDDHIEMVNILNRYFHGVDNFKAVACNSVEEAMSAIKDNSPEVIFLDNSLTPGGNEGIEIAKLIKKIDPDFKIYSTTTSASFEFVYKKMGIDHIDKGDVEAMQAILSGEKL